MIDAVIEEALTEIEQSLPTELECAAVAYWHDLQKMLVGYARRLNDAAAMIGTVCAETVPRQQGATVTSDGRKFRRTGQPRRSSWRTDDLERVVRDTRLFDRATGELLRPDELVRMVFPLGTPRLNALKTLGIDPDDYSTVSWVNRGIEEVV